MIRFIFFWYLLLHRMSTFQDLVLEGAATDYHPGLTEVSEVGEFNNHLQSYIVFISFYCFKNIPSLIFRQGNSEC